jgi:two-component system CheB/CheR fusion protein
LIDNFSDQVHLSIYVLVNLIATLLFSRVQRQRRLAETRSVENERLSQSLRDADNRKDEFLALLAHELRNPLAPIRTSLALLNRKPDSIESVKKAHGIIERQTNQLVRITDDLLDIARFCQGKLELQIGRIDLRDALTDAVEMVECLIEAKSHRLQLLMPQGPVWVDGDRVRLAQLTANLLGNAAKYTPQGGRITLQVDCEDSTVAIVVSDNGIGFFPGDADRILEPFMQIDTSRTREYGGLGVGLTIVQRLVTLHRGQLIANSRGPGLGSCFTVNLPAAQTQHAEEPVSEFHLPRTIASEVESFGLSHLQESTISTGRKPTVLIVEDSHDAAELLGELLESEGYHCHVANDGIAALQLVHRNCPDVVILDIGLPGMDGYEVARRIRRLEFAKHVRLIALTGWGGPADRELTREVGFDLHLVKPVSFAELLSVIEEMEKQPNNGVSVSSCE